MEGIRQDTRQAVERLEGQVARLRAAVWILFLALIGAGGFVAWQRLHPKAQPGVVRVQGLVVEDKNGAARLLLTPRGVQWSDERGQTRMELSLKDDGSGQMVLNDAQGMAAFTASPGALTLTDAKKDSAILTTAGGATLQLRRGDKVMFKQPWDAPELALGQK
jgi:hypothetical protein